MEIGLYISTILAAADVVGLCFCGAYIRDGYGAAPWVIGAVLGVCLFGIVKLIRFFDRHTYTK